MDDMQTQLVSGGCTCGQVRYSLHAEPMIVHCCHCSWCQRETGSAFVINALIEASKVSVEGRVEQINTPSQSGNGQVIARCPQCRIALWSNYYQAGPNVRFIRVGTLDKPATFTPDIHLYTSTKVPWVLIPDNARAVPEFYDPKSVWSQASLDRFYTASSATQVE